MKKTETYSRLHFIVKSFIMGLMGTLITLVIVFFVGKVDFIQLMIIGVFAYSISLMILRVGDSVIEFVTHKVLKFLDRHPSIKNFITHHF